MTSRFHSLRADFLALDQKPFGQPLVYLDTAATALKPKPVVEVLSNFYNFEASNVHRGAHYLSDRATEKFEATRERVRQFLAADKVSEVIFTKGTTDSINLVAQTFGRQRLRAGDEIVLSEMEHHSNIVPWQILAKEKGLVIKWAPVDDSGELIFTEYKKLLNEKTRLVSLSHCSNAIGTVNSLREYVGAAHQVGAKVLIDAAQSVTFMTIDVKVLECDFLVFSAHKLYGPFGVGVLFARQAIMDELDPRDGGGAIISEVTKEKTTYLGVPQRFEAGTPNISGVIGLGAAIDYVQSVGLQEIERHAKDLHLKLTSRLNEIEGLVPVGTSASRVNILSFVLKGAHPSDIGQLLDRQGIAVRVGHHCAQPLMRRFGVPGTVRASFGVYNTEEDVEILMRAIQKSQEILT